MPVAFKNLGKIKRKIVINPNVLKKDIIADNFPLDNAVNKEEAKILYPENKKLKEKIENPIFIISKTFKIITSISHTTATYAPIR